MTATCAQGPGYEVRFDSLAGKDGEFAFPCNAQGCVDIDQLSEKARRNYYFARSLIGRDFARPSVRRVIHDDSRSPR